MTETPPPPPSAASELARRFGLIMAGLAALVAARFLRMPAYAAMIVPLWHQLQRAARRFERAVTRPLAKPRVSVRKAAAADAVPAERTPRPVQARLPGGHGWLVRVLGWEAAGYMSQLDALLAEPAMQMLLAERANAARILRPVCRILGLGPKRVRKPRPRVMRTPRAKPAVAPFYARPRKTRATWRPPKLTWAGS